MDTRSKILISAEALVSGPARPLVLVSGYFDVLRAEHVRELSEIHSRSGAQTVVVAVVARAGALLPQRARAELVAALRVVDYVFIANPEDLDGLNHSLQPAEWVRLEELDARRTRQLIEHVHRRQTG